MDVSRRDFLKLLTAFACPDPIAGGRQVGVVPFDGAERVMPFHTLVGSGLDARLSTDLSDLTADTLVTATSKYFIRTSAPDPGNDPRAPWTIRLTGLVTDATALPLDELERHAHSTDPILTECAGNTSRAGFGLMSAATWSGARVADVVKKAGVRAGANRVRISGVDRHAATSTSSLPGAGWVFTFDQLESSGALLATRMNGEPLTPDHGRPVRLVVPVLYVWACI